MYMGSPLFNKRNLPHFLCRPAGLWDLTAVVGLPFEFINSSSSQSKNSSSSSSLSVIFSKYVKIYIYLFEGLSHLIFIQFYHILILTILLQFSEIVNIKPSF